MKDENKKQTKKEEKWKCDCGCDENCECGCSPEKCECEEKCHCNDEHCNCSDNKAHKHSKQNNQQCGCNTHKHSDSHCTCDDDCNCDEHCDCDDECCCDDENCDCHSHEDVYLNMAKQIQADFDNYRRRNLKLLESTKQQGLIDAVKSFLPALDSFKKAKEMTADKKTLEGLLMVEKQILKSFKDLGVEKIEALGKKYDHNFHNVVAIVNNKDKDDDVVVEEYQCGYKIGDKIVRYSQVIVNKK